MAVLVTLLGEDNTNAAALILYARLPGRLPGLYCIQTDANGERKFLYWRNYGVAVAYCIRAGDGRRLGVIAEKILDEYVRNGQSSP